VYRVIGLVYAMRIALIAAVSSILLAAGVQAQAPGGVRGPAMGMATRPVSKYLNLERQLQQALAEHDRAAVSAMLDADFQLRTLAVQDTIGQEEWLRRMPDKPSPAMRVRDLSVLEKDDLATISFLLEPIDRKAGRHAEPTYFVVDLWRQSSGKLQARYLSVPANPPALRSGPDTRE
jgi:hypothetical protein